MTGLAVGLVLAFVVPVRGYLDQRSQLRREESALAVERAQRDALGARLRALREPDVREARARELHMVMPGERVFRIGSLPGGN